MNGSIIHYQRQGAGPTVIAVHGGPGLGLQSFLPELLGLTSSADLVLYDQRGCGLSPLAGGDAGDAEIHISDLEQLYRRLGVDRAILLGHSWGAWLSLAYAQRFPARVRGLVLVCPPPVCAESPEQVHRWFSCLTPEMRRAVGEVSLSTLPPAERLNRRLEIVLPLYFHDERGVQSFLARGIRVADAYDERAVARLMEADLRPGLPHLDMPAVFIAGRHDRRTPPDYAREIAAQMPNAELRIMESVGHFPFLEDPAAFLTHVHQAMERIEREVP
jgi:pimeloyl-ACP methyl ester carboxylesterase